MGWSEYLALRTAGFFASSSRRHSATSLLWASQNRFSRPWRRSEARTERRMRREGLLVLGLLARRGRSAEPAPEAPICGSSACRWRLTCVRSFGWTLTKKTSRSAVPLGRRQAAGSGAPSSASSSGEAAGHEARPARVLQEERGRAPSGTGYWERRLISSRSSLPGLKCGIFLAGTTTPAPVFGLRPVRLSRRRTGSSRSPGARSCRPSAGLR